jgi:dolichol-phosphate mannosyltransferase
MLESGEVEGTGNPTGSSPKVSIVLATLNERQNLPSLLEGIQSQSLPPFEVIVVDDGSTDGTREMLREVASRTTWLRLICHEGRQTLTPAQCQGISAARGEYVVIMDADLQHPTDTIPDMISALEGGADLVIGTRYGPGGSTGDRPPYRGLVSLGAEFTARVLVPPARHVSDPLSGFFAFRRKMFRPIDPRYRGYKLLLFLLVMFRDRHVKEVAYSFKCRTNGSSKLTETTGFVKVFLVETLLASRFAGRLDRTRLGSSPPVRSIPKETTATLLR